MKFGETLYQRSVPKWAAYNVNYNEIKRLIKERTSKGLAVPVSIPTGSSNNRWTHLEDDVFAILNGEYENVSLFLRSKYGEIDRRLTYLEKQVRSAQKGVALSNNPLLQNRRYHKLAQDAESIGQDIQNLTRFAGVQKTAVRKILKKYRKWTGSTTLQTRLENEVFSAGQFGLDYAHPLERLTNLSITIKELQKASERGRSPARDEDRDASSTTISAVGQINAAEERGPVALDAALATIPFGKSSGSATYWIHPDNLDEAQALLLRHMREVHKVSELSRESSVASMTSGRAKSRADESSFENTHVAYLDNPQRFVQDTTSNRPSKVALSARWCQGADAVVTLSNLAPRNPSGTIVNVRRKDIAKVLSRKETEQQSDQRRTSKADGTRRVQEYLSQNRDVKPLAKMLSTRSRYVGTTNSAMVGAWATLDSDILVTPFSEDTVDGKENLENDVETGEAFPHSVLEIRWEFSHMPEIVRAFDSTHLAERVKEFSLESAAIHTVNKKLQAPSWKPLLEKDIRKVPVTTRTTSARRGSISKRMPGTEITSSTQSTETDGPTNSVFSAPNGLSSAASLTSPDASTRDLSLSTEVKSVAATTTRKKKKARISAPSPPPRVSRYWNEFDDGDEDVNPTEAYTIYVDPNASLFPGTDTIAKAFGAVYTSFGDAKSRVSSMFSLKSQPPQKRKKNTERRHLLDPTSRSNSDDPDSSDSDTTPIEASPPDFGTFASPKAWSRSLPPTSRPSPSNLYRPHQILTGRQKALERTYFMFYAGLLVLSYVLLFISGVLTSTGRKKAYVEVDIAVFAGIATAETCAILAMILLWMRRSPLSIIHRAIVHAAIVGILLIGVAEVATIIRRPSKK